MYKQIIILCLFFGVIVLHAENKNQFYQITGQAVEVANGKSIPYATISLLSDSTSVKVLKRVSSDVNGKFSFFVKEKREYTIVLSFMGFQEKKVSVKVSGLKTDLEKIGLENGIMLKEVSVMAQKTLVKVDPDKLTYSVDADPDAQSSSTLEILRKISLITIDSEDNVALNGQSNFKVLVNGKSSSLMTNNFKDVIKSIPANTIKDIEVITNPSSKYDAEGIGGIINIITIKKKTAGYNGSVNSGCDSQGSWNGGLYLATKINKFSFSARYSFNQYQQPQMAYDSKRTDYLSDLYHTSNSSELSKNEGRSHNFSGEASYEIDSLDLISTSFWGYSGNNHNNSFSSTNTLNTSDLQTKYFENNIRGQNNNSTLSANVNYQRTFKKPDRTFTVSYKLDNTPNTASYESDITNTFNYSPYQQKSSTDAFTREQTLQVDYYDPLSKIHQIECGVKAIYRQNNSNSDTYLLNQTTNTWDYSIPKSNELDYDQYILGAYAGYGFNLKKFTAKGGLRTELTWNNATSTSDSVVKFTNQMKNLVPYIILNYQLKPESTIKASYTQRLYRPGIWYLNPYVNTRNPQNIFYGNPYLKAEISHSFELGYNTFTPKFNLSLTGRGVFSGNSIEDISTVNALGVRSTTYKNIGINMNVGLNLYLSYRPNEKFNIYCNANGYYSEMQAYNGYTISNKGYNYGGSIGTRFVLWKDGSINANGGVYSPGIMLQGKSSFYYYSGISASQSLLNKKLMLSVSISNPLTKIMSYSSTYNDPYYYQLSESSYYARTLRFNVTYNFGKMGLEVKKARRGIQNDDVKSSGSNNGGGSN